MPVCHIWIGVVLYSIDLYLGFHLSYPIKPMVPYFLIDLDFCTI